MTFTEPTSRPEPRWPPERPVVPSPLELEASAISSDRAAVRWQGRRDGVPSVTIGSDSAAVRWQGHSEGDPIITVVSNHAAIRRQERSGVVPSVTVGSDRAAAKWHERRGGVPSAIANAQTEDGDLDPVAP